MRTLIFFGYRTTRVRVRVLVLHGFCFVGGAWHVLDEFERTIHHNSSLIVRVLIFVVQFIIYVGIVEHTKSCNL